VAAAAIVAETPQDWTTQIERLLEHPSLASDRGALGRAAVEAACRWETCLGPWDDLLEQAASTRPAEDGATASPSLAIAADSRAVRV
jgi:hypothetical protein